MNELVSRLLSNVEEVIFSKRDRILMIIAAMLCEGHILVEDVPGVGKTKLVAALARSVNGRFNRVQLTPDVMPSDITGFMMIEPETRKMVYQPGAAVCNFLLVDEINRASPKVQSALLEIMEENQISIDSKTYQLPKPFITFATQNPVESYGTYHLPEAQMDRFLIKISVGYPSKADEKRLLGTSESKDTKSLQGVLTTADIVRLQEEVSAVKVNEQMKEYIMQIVLSTRNNPHFTLGVSPRGSMGLNNMAKAVAFINDRGYVIPEDVQMVASIVLSHRVILSASGKGTYASAPEAIESIISGVPVPRQGDIYEGSQLIRSG